MLLNHLNPNLDPTKFVSIITVALLGSPKGKATRTGKMFAKRFKEAPAILGYDIRSDQLAWIDSSGFIELVERWERDGVACTDDDSMGDGIRVLKPEVHAADVASFHPVIVAYRTKMQRDFLIRICLKERGTCDFEEY